MADKMRVACLYRVSTKKQVDQDDIPMQKRACREFANKQEWEIVREYSEKGISGYKISMEDRDEFQRVMKDAKKGLFDVLLVFMFDRIGRQDIESLYYSEILIKMGIKIWSAKEGELSLKSFQDRIMASIKFGGAREESEKISIRVSEKHEQMAKDGYYRGGTPPYGYSHVKSGEVNKKGKELLKLERDINESAIVSEIFNLVYEFGYGANRIAKHLNDKKVPTRNGGGWSTATLNTILKNPIYKGYMAYGKRSAKSGSSINQSRDNWITPDTPDEELVIVSAEVWDKVQEMRTKRNPENVSKKKELVNPTKSPLLLTGLTRCGHCGAAISTTYNYKSWTLADGTVQKKRLPKYRCSGKALNATNCDGQTIYSQEKIEGIVLKQVNIYLDKLKQVDLTSHIEKRKKANEKEIVSKLKQLQKQIEEYYQELSVLNNEIPKALMGKSAFKPELLNSLIEQKNQEISTMNVEITALEKIEREVNEQTRSIEMIQKHIPVWSDVFENALFEKKKMMLQSLIEKVVIFKDRIRVQFKPQFEEIMKLRKQMSGESATLAV
ncbi:recombinase family protein [Brevibacillus migulae]|uniref:recombinase family protein n=1 Tax=Brevibacillus migulae TaxID=1644114 RepID=UPI0014316A9B|nr:recombinase family protein [Brevibacillus migulae]